MGCLTYELQTLALYGNRNAPVAEEFYPCTMQLTARLVKPDSSDSVRVLASSGKFSSIVATPAQRFLIGARTDAGVQSSVQPTEPTTIKTKQLNGNSLMENNH